MNIELLKKLEDLKQDKQQLSMKLSDALFLKKENHIRSVIADFSKFFKSKGFEVNPKKNRIEASYHGLQAVLSYDDFETNYMGVYFVFDLDLETLHQKKYTIALNDTSPGFSASFSRVNTSSDDNQLQQEIKKTEEMLDELKQHIETIDNESWKLFIKDDENNQGYYSAPEFDTMETLLESLFK